MTHITCRLTAKNWDQLRNHTLCNRVWATFFVLMKRNLCWLWFTVKAWSAWILTWRYDTRHCFNVQSKAGVSQLNLPHGTNSFVCHHQPPYMPYVCLSVCVVCWRTVLHRWSTSMSTTTVLWNSPHWDSFNTSRGTLVTHTTSLAHPGAVLGQNIWGPGPSPSLPLVVDRLKYK